MYSKDILRLSDYHRLLSHTLELTPYRPGFSARKSFHLGIWAIEEQSQEVHESLGQCGPPQGCWLVYTYHEFRTVIYTYKML